MEGTTGLQDLAVALTRPDQCPDEVQVRFKSTIPLERCSMLCNNQDGEGNYSSQ